MTKQDCSEIFAKLSEYLDDDLPADICESMTEHIAACTPCVEFVASLRETMALSRQAAKEIEGEKLKAEVKAQLEEAYARFRTFSGS